MNILIDFSSLEDFDKFFDQFENTISSEIFKLKNVKIIQNLYCGYTSDPVYQKLKTYNIFDVDYDEFYIPAGTVCDLRRINSNLAILIYNEVIELSRNALSDAVIELELTNLGERCIEKDDNIENIFNVHDCLINVEKFLDNAPKIFTLAFKANELFEYFITNTYDSKNCNDESWSTQIMLLLVPQLQDAIKSVKVEDIEGPDDFSMSIIKDINTYATDNEFSIKGKFICCFYSNSKIQFNDLKKSINSYKFNNIRIYDIVEPSNTPGISMNGIYSDERTIYIKANYELVYVLK